MPALREFLRCSLSVFFLLSSSLCVAHATAEINPPAHLDNVIYGNAPLTVQFNASRLGLGGELSYHWDFGDGSSSDDPSPRHTYELEGQYSALLTVNSSEGGQALQTVTIYTSGTVEPPYPVGDVNRDCRVNILDLVTVRNNLGSTSEGGPCDINGDGKIDILDLIRVRDNLGRTCLSGQEPPPPTQPPRSPDPTWEYLEFWEGTSITTPKSDDGPFAQRAQVWDLGETIPFTFAAAVDKPEGALLPWFCTVRNYWGELLHTESGTTLVGPAGQIFASCSWTADYLGIINVAFECETARASIFVAVIRPMGDLWNNTANPFGGMGQHPGYDEYGPYLDLQKRIGMKRLRIPVLTESASPGPATLNNGYLDRAIDPLTERGFESFLLLTYFPGWMKENGVLKPEWADIDTRIDWFAEYVGRVVAYCKTKGVTHYEIWNEPNLGHFWGWGEAKYCELLRKAYTTAKAADPDCVIMNGGMPGIPGAFNSYIGKAIIDGDYNDCCDILAGHYYRRYGGYSPEHPLNHMRQGFEEAAARAGIAGKPAWDTESDYGYFYQCEWESMNWYTRQMAYMLSTGVNHITVYAFASVKEKLGYTSTWWHNFFGILANKQIPTFTYDDWPSSGDYRKSVDCFVYTPMPRYPAHSTTVHELLGATDWTATALPDENVVFLYQEGSDVRAVCWRGHEERFVRPVDLVRGLQTSLQPRAIRDVFGNPVASGVIPLGPSPVYVDFGSDVTIAAAKAAVEAGAITASPAVSTGSFNLDFIAMKLYRKSTGMPLKWHVLSPIDDPSKSSYNSVVPAQVAIASDGGVKMEGTAHTWTPTATAIEANSSKIDLAEAFAPDNEDKTTILYAEFFSPTARRGRIHYSASDEARIWLNGEQVADQPSLGLCLPNRFTAPGHRDGLGIFWGVKPGLAEIRQGRNTVVVKIHTGSSSFGLHFRIAWENFDTMADLTWLP